MVVSRDDFSNILEHLKSVPELGLDSETTGLRMYHGAELFSLIISTPAETYYFNFKDYADTEPDFDHKFFLGRVCWEQLCESLFADPDRIWFIQRAANFDLPILSRWGGELAGTVHCTLTCGRVVYNDRHSFSLETQLPDIGLQKDKSAEEYINTHKLYKFVDIPGKNARDKDMDYSRIPFKVITAYGTSDGDVVKLGLYQVAEIKRLDEQFPELIQSNRSLANVMHNERRLVKTIHRMKDYGIKIDTEYCKKAIVFETDRSEKAAKQFQLEAGVPYKASPKLFEQVFASVKDQWGVTKKGNPSFDADCLAKLDHPAARAILEMRDAKSKADFYQGFLYHADSRGVVHPDFNAEGAIHGRFSSSNPNFQNLTKEDDEEQIAGEFIIRRAVVPRDGFFLIMPDYQQMEYKFALEMACRLIEELTPLGKMIVDGFDFHDATGARVKDVVGREFPRKIIKNANFLTLYGGGAGKMAETLKIPIREARIIRGAIKSAAPELDNYIQTIMQIAVERKFIVNWFGRRCHFPVKHFAYKAPNYHISGGCADVVKIAMNRIDEYLLNKKSKMIMTVHDELPIEVHESEANEVPAEVERIMQSVFKFKYIPLTTSMEHSFKSLGDKVKGFPV